MMLARQRLAEQSVPGSTAGVAVLVDYDGTVATVDVTDELVRSSSSEDAWLELELAYRRGAIGSRDLLEAEARLLPSEPAAMRELSDEHGHDPAFAPFVRYAREVGIPVEVVSDGLGFFVRPALASVGLGDLPVFAADVEFRADGPSISFPDGHPLCRVCGTCKRDRVLAHQTLGRHVVFVGDGYSDQYAVSYADTVFAKDDLAEICRRNGVAYHPWTGFGDIQAWLEEMLPQLTPPRSRGYVCGPETEQLVAPS